MSDVEIEVKQTYCSQPLLEMAAPDGGTKKSVTDQYIIRKLSEWVHMLGSTLICRGGGLSLDNGMFRNCVIEKNCNYFPQATK